MKAVGLCNSDGSCFLHVGTTIFIQSATGTTLQTSKACATATQLLLLLKAVGCKAQRQSDI
jgi:hypothetical protein